MEPQESAQASEAGDVKQGGGVPGFQLAAQDGVFGLVLIILAVAVGGLLAAGEVPAAVVSAALLWGVVRLRQWALWATVVLGGIGVCYQLLVLFDVLRGSEEAALFAIPINLFALLVLLTRREHFTRGL